MPQPFRRSLRGVHAGEPSPKNDNVVVAVDGSMASSWREAGAVQNKVRALPGSPRGYCRSQDRRFNASHACLHAPPPAVSTVIIVGLAGSVLAAPTLTFEKDVRPILKEHCFHCHGEDGETKGGLDVRLARFLLKGGDERPAIVSGKPASITCWPL